MALFSAERRRAALTALDERTGFIALWHAFTGRQVPGAPSFGRALGGATLVVFLFVALTGVALAFTYVPSIQHAWASTAHLETSVPLGAFLRGLHYHGTNVLFVMVGLLLAHAIATAAWRRPGEVAWVLLVLAVLHLPAFAITGNLLPMDQDAFHGAQVELAVIDAAPFGGFLKGLLLGGDAIGPPTLPRFFALHAIVLPAATLGLVGLLLVVARRRAVPVEGDGVAVAARKGLRVVGLVAMALGAAALLAATLGARLDAPADPSSAFTARPEWYFVALNQLNTLFGTFGAIALPGLAVGFLLALPVLDRGARAGRSARPGPTVLIPAALLGLGLVGLTAKGLLEDADDEKLATETARIAEAAAEAREAFVAHGVDAEGRLPHLAALAIYRDEGCASCHDKKEGNAPRLAGWASVARTSAFLAAPDDARFFKHTPLAGEMSAFSGDAEAREALARYLLKDSGLRLDPPTTPAQLEAGRTAFIDDGCDACHNDPEVSLRDKRYDFRAVGPDLRGYAGREWTRALIRDAHHPTLFGGSAEEGDLPKLMPAYPDLDEARLQLLVEWLVAGAPGAK
jgi:ubiquinol-cytochrome c reductase cytochrome b subunit